MTIRFLDEAEAAVPQKGMIRFIDDVTQDQSHQSPKTYGHIDIPNIAGEAMGMLNPFQSVAKTAMQPDVMEAGKNLPASLERNLNPVKLVGGAYQAGKMVGSGQGGELLKEIGKNYNEAYGLSDLAKGNFEGALQKTQDTVKSDPVRPVVDIFGVKSLGTATKTSAKGALNTARKALTPDLDKTLVKALGPQVSNENFTRNAGKAYPVAVEAAERKGLIPDNIEDLETGVRIAKKETLAKSKQALKDAGIQIPKIKGDSIADAIESTFKGNLETGDVARVLPLEDGVVNAMKQRASFFRGREFTPEELNQALVEANNELSGYYKQNFANRKISFSEPETAWQREQVKAIRESLDNAFAQIPGSTGKQMRELYGSLTSFENDVVKRRIIVERGAGQNLQQTINKPFAIGRAAVGVGKAITGVPGGANDILGAGSQIIASEALKELTSTQGLLRAAHSKLKRIKIAEQPYTQQALDITKRSLPTTIGISTMLDNRNNDTINKLNTYRQAYNEQNR